MILNTHLFQETQCITKPPGYYNDPSNTYGVYPHLDAPSHPPVNRYDNRPFRQINEVLENKPDVISISESTEKILKDSEEVVESEKLVDVASITLDAEDHFNSNEGETSLTP